MVMSLVVKALRLMPVVRSRAGQAMVEYVVVAGMLVAALLIFYFFLGTFKEFGTRVLNLIGSEYP